MNAAQREAHVVDSLVWPRYALGELCRIELGSTPARSYARNWDSPRSTQNVWLSIADMPTDLHALALDSREYVSDAATGRMRLVPKGTLLVSFKLTLGRLCYAGRDLYTNEAIAALHDLDPARICSEYLYWYLTYFDWQAAAEGEDKVKGKTLNKAKLELLPVLVPPLDEQKRIVAVLDQAFAALDRARAHAEANLADAVELFDRYLSHEMSGIRRASGIPNSSGADIRLMKDIVTFHNGDRGKNYPNKSEYVVAGIPWINTGHIMEDGSLSEEKMNFISEAKFKQLGGGKTEVGDLVFCLRGATIGKTAFVGPYSPGAVASSLMIIRPGKEIVDKYAYYFLTSELGKSEIRRFIGGAAQPNLAGKSVGEFNVPLPSIEEQKRIVERIGAVQRNVEKSKRRYQQKLGDLANLRQSLLQKAFSGELT